MDGQSDLRGLYIEGLRNAHGMESQALSVMRPQVSRIDKYPEVKAALEQHIAETEGQLQRLESLLADAGTDKSLLKDAALSIAGTMAALGHTPAADEILKNSFANFAFENFEIAAYNSLIFLARAAGEDQAIPVLQQNLAEEQKTAKWLEDHLAAVTEKYASLTASGEKAKT